MSAKIAVNWVVPIKWKKTPVKAKLDLGGE
jgi:hypothetical protein